MRACAGDYVGYGPCPNECVERLKGLEVVGVSGNHDLGSIGKVGPGAFNVDARGACEWTAGALSPESASCPGELDNVQRECGWLLVQGSHRDPYREYIISCATAGSMSLEFKDRLSSNGHAHSPAVSSCSFDALMTGGDVDVDMTIPGDGGVIEIQESRCHLANVGSVDQPRDGDPRACYVEDDSGSATMTYRRVEYPVGRTRKQMEEVGLPGLLIERVAEGR